MKVITDISNVLIDNYVGCIKSNGKNVLQDKIFI